jgi:hypothetical protein
MKRFVSAIFWISLVFGHGPAKADPRFNLSGLNTEYRDAIIAAKEVMKDDHTVMAEADRNRFYFLIENAYALTDLDPKKKSCFYGGWQSVIVTQGDRDVCENPTLHTNYLSEGCKPELACNPAFFGPSLCVDVSTTALRQTTFSRCEQRFQKERSGSYSFLNKLKEAEATDLVQTLDAVGKACSTAGSPKPSKMCVRLVAKVKSIRSKIGNKASPVNTQEKTPAIGSPTTTTSTAPENSSTVTASCTSCASLQLNSVLPSLSQVTNTISALQTTVPGEIYKRIKDEYMASGKCHRYSYLSESDLKAFKLSQFSTELRNFSEEAFRNPPGALEVLISSMGLPQGEANELRASYAALPRYSAPDALNVRAKFQAKIVRKIMGHLDSEPLKTITNDRIARVMKSQGVEEDCDFISEAAFKEAYLAKKAFHGSGVTKPNILTVVDHTLPQSARRMITFDITPGNEKVLFHTIAGFGTAEGLSDRGTLTHGESNKCSNKGGSYASPFGLAVTKSTTTSNGGFDGKGTFMNTLNGTQDRRIALHHGGSDLFDSYSDYKPGEKLNAVLNGDETPSLVSSAISSGYPGHTVSPGTTNGCIGIPNSQLEAVQNTIEHGSVVYFYCSDDMKR